jgi:excinuclease ABC subunit A
VLEVKLHGKSIADVLEMPCGDAVELFAGHPKVARILQTLCDVGLDYVTLGQSAPSLSGGEAQRVKLAAELARPVTGNTLYLLDEPTTGLHFDDIDKLLGVLQRLVELGNTVVVIEHNLDVIKCADWIIDMGPGAGADGGQIVFTGSPEDLAAAAAKKSPRKRAAGPELSSATAPFLAQTLADHSTKETSPGDEVSAAVAAPATVPRDASRAVRVDPASPLKPSSTPPKKKKSGEKASEGLLDPWKVLGRRWHSLGKGFPDGVTPNWPLELVDRMLKLLEQVAGDDSLAFDAPDRVNVKPSGRGDTWAEVETKTPESLKVTLAGPKEAIDLDELTALNIDGPVDLSDRGLARVTLNLTEVKHVRSRKLRTFLKSHLERTVK